MDDDYKKIFVYYFDNHTLRAETAKKIGTRKNYFASLVEIGLNQLIEDKMGKIVNRIITYFDLEKSCHLTSEECLTISRYFFTNQLRSESNLNLFKQESTTALLFTDQQNHSDMIFCLLRNLECEKIRESLKNISIMILVNGTERHFISSRQGACELLWNKKTWTIMPISPKYAIAVCLDINDAPVCKFIDDDKTVNFINVKIATEEVKQNNHFLISNSKDTLEHVLSQLNKRI